MDRERFLAPEILFNPTLAGMDGNVEGVSDMVFNSIWVIYLFHIDFNIY